MMTNADLHGLKIAALNLAENVRRAESLPLLARAPAAMKAAADQAALNVRLVGMIEFLSMRLAALETESGGASNIRGADNGERGQGQGNLPVL